MKLVFSMENINLNQILANRIIILRKEKNLTSEQLAYRSGISKGGLSEIERGCKEPRLCTILKICAGLDITVNDFFNFYEIEQFKSIL